MLHELPARAAACWPGHLALTVDGRHWSYADLQSQMERCAAGLQALGLERGARVVRVHDVRETVQALKVQAAVEAALPR